MRMFISRRTVHRAQFRVMTRFFLVMAVLALVWVVALLLRVLTGGVS